MTKKVEFKKQGKEFKKSTPSTVENNNSPKVNPDRSYKVLIADLVGMKFDKNGNPDFSEVRDYIQEKGGLFHLGSSDEDFPSGGVMIVCSSRRIEVG